MSIPPSENSGSRSEYRFHRNTIDDDQKYQRSFFTSKRWKIGIVLSLFLLLLAVAFAVSPKNLIKVRASGGCSDYGVPNCASNGAVTVLSQNYYHWMTVGQQYTASVTMQNTGTSTWTNDPVHPYRLGAINSAAPNPLDSTTWGPTRVELPHPVAPNERVTFTFTVTAPSTPGAYSFEWKMVQDGVAWFGDTAHYANKINVSTNNAQFISESVPTSSLRSGQQVNVSVTMKNTGTSTWTSDALYRLGINLQYNPPQDYSYFGIQRVELPQPVPPDQTVTFNFTITVPAIPDLTASYGFTWQMLQENQEWFGEFSCCTSVGVDNR